MPDTETSPTAGDLAGRIRKPKDADIEAAHAVAVEMVDLAIVDAFRPVPPGVYRECVLSVGYAVYDRSKSSHGVGQQVTVEGGTPVRSPRDPKASIRTILVDYLPPGLA